MVWVVVWPVVRGWGSAPPAFYTPGTDKSVFYIKINLCCAEGVRVAGSSEEPVTLTPSPATSTSPGVVLRCLIRVFPPLMQMSRMQMAWEGRDASGGSPRVLPSLALSRCGGLCRGVRIQGAFVPVSRCGGLSAGVTVQGASVPGVTRWRRAALGRAGAQPVTWLPRAARDVPCSRTVGVTSVVAGCRPPRRAPGESGPAALLTLLGAPVGNGGRGGLSLPPGRTGSDEPRLPPPSAVVCAVPPPVAPRRSPLAGLGGVGINRGRRGIPRSLGCWSGNRYLLVFTFWCFQWELWMRLPQPRSGEIKGVQELCGAWICAGERGELIEN